MALVRELREVTVDRNGGEVQVIQVENIEILEVKGCAVCGAPVIEEDSH